MKLAVLTSLFPSAQRPREGIFALRRWTAMAERGHEIRVVHPLPWAPPAPLGKWVGRPDWAAIALAPRVETIAGIAVRRPRFLHLPGRGLSNARRFGHVGAKAIRAGGAVDAVVADYAWPAAAAVSELKRAGLPTFVHGRGSDVLAVRDDARLAPTLAEALRASDGWLAVSRDLVLAMDQLAGSARGTLVPNGVDFDLFRPRDRQAARAQLGWTEPGPRVLVVGHLIDRKDPLLALRAFAALEREDARLEFIGSGPLEGRLRAAAAPFGDRVALRGEWPPERLALAYAAADVLLLTSSREGRPNVVLEALASGCGVVATAAGGTSELLESLPGAVVASRDEQAIARALRATLAQPTPPQKLRDSVAHLSWEKSCEALEACLQRAVDARRTA